MKRYKISTISLFLLIISLCLTPISFRNYALAQNSAEVAKLQKDIPKQWTFMVFMNADNNLELPAIKDFLEMASVGSTDQVNIVVQLDLIPGGLDLRNINLSEDWDLGEVDMGAPQTLVDFANWAKQNYPAEHYALVIWDHGSGWWAKTLQKIAIKSISIDDTSGSEMDMLELRSALNSITNGGAEKLDIIGFDACLMGMIEIYYQIQPFGNVAIGSEETEPGDGWDYKNSLSALTSEPTMSADLLATKIVEDYMSYYKGKQEDVTLSAIDLNTLDNLVTSASNLAEDLGNTLFQYRDEVEQVSDMVEWFKEYTFYKDLYHFASLIQTSIEDTDIQSDVQNVINAINSTVIAEEHGSLHPNVGGISIYFPDPRYDSYMSSYETNTEFAKDTQWDEFLRVYNLSQPDLIVTGITSIPNFSLPGQEVQVTVNFANQGSDAGAFWIDLYKDRDTAPSSGDMGDDWAQISGLSAGQTSSTTFTYTYNTEGIKKVWAQIDTDNEVAEANEKNNIFGPYNLSVIKPPSIAHTPVAFATKGEPITISADITDDSGVSSATLYYRKGGGGPYSSVPMSLLPESSSTYTASIPASEVTERGIEYYIEAKDIYGGTATSPIRNGR